MWLRHDLETFRKRLKALEAKAAQEHPLLTEEQLRALERAREEKKAHGRWNRASWLPGHARYCTIQEEFYATAFRKKLYHSLEELQADLDAWLDDLNQSVRSSVSYYR